MEKLSNLGIKPHWNTENDNVIEDFYIKTLSNSIRYDRASFGFGSTILTHVAEGLDGLIDNDGTIRLLIGEYLDEPDIDAIKDGFELQEKHQELCLKKLKIALKENNTRSELNSHRFELLRYFVGAKRLEIKYAALRNNQGIFHDKSGVIYGKDDEKISFKGSGNFTKYGTDYNWESFNVFPSWKEDVYADYGEMFEKDFEKLWNDRSKKCKVIQLPNEELDKVMRESGNSSSYSKHTPPEKKELRIILDSKTNPAPEIPEKINGNKFEIRDYQTNALTSWKEKGFKGIFEHATGSGKTLTAIYGITTLFLSPRTTGNTVVIIGVPYTILADQWAEELGFFNIVPIMCYGGVTKWQSKINNRLSELQISDTNQLVVIIVVNATLFKSPFQSVLKKIEDMGINSIFIGDECHEYRNKKPEQMPQSKYMLGLSATPFNERSRDDKDNERLRKSFGDICDTFSLKEALDQDYLCQYEYHPIPIRLTEEEEKEYMRLSSIIASIYSDPKKSDSEAGAVLSQRARVIGSADEKFIKFKSLVKKWGNQKNTLIFTGDGKTEDISEEEVKDKERAEEILKSVGWETAEFTSEVNLKQRKIRIERFVERDLNALIAIKVLDQGFNIPAIQTAVIMASTRSKRQYIQRLGRILRKAENKNMSYIYDFIVLPYSQTDLSNACTNLIKEEEIRFKAFAENASNIDELELLSGMFNI